MASTLNSSDLTIEALAHQLSDTEHLYISTRFVLFAALKEIRRLHRQLQLMKRYHAMDVDQLKQLMGIENAHHE